MSSSADYDCVVIGAGAAGIAAARVLARAGRRACVIEARNRIGGRAFTQDVAGFPLDLGCGWLHSADRNILLSLASENGFEIDRELAPWQKSADERSFSREDQRAYRADMGLFSRACVKQRPQVLMLLFRSFWIQPRAGRRSSKPCPLMSMARKQIVSRFSIILLMKIRM